MILTQCAACARPISHTAPRCARCHTRYCGPTCQKEHWEGGGHSVLCKKIKRRGGAEQYNADNKCKEAIAEAVEACAEDTKGQTCYICTQALHWKTKEGLVRMCSCRGTSGFVHVSCLAEQARILVAEGEENNVDNKASDERWARWRNCRLCGQDYHGPVLLALSWSCWKTYLDRPETNFERGAALNAVGIALMNYPVNRWEEAIEVFKSVLDVSQRIGVHEVNLLATENNIAECYAALGSSVESLQRFRSMHARLESMNEPSDERVLFSAISLGDSLLDNGLFAEAQSFLRENCSKATRALGPNAYTTLRLRRIYALALARDPNATRAAIVEASTVLEDAATRARRFLGPGNPMAGVIIENLEAVRAILADPTTRHRRELE